MSENTLQKLSIGKNIPERVSNLEIQVDMHTSFLESEAGTRARAHRALHERLDAQDKILKRLERCAWVGVGGILLIKLLAEIKALL